MEEEKFFEMIDHLKDMIDQDESRSEEEREHYKYCKWPILYKISTLMSSTSFDLMEVLEAIVDVAIEITSASRGFIILFDENRNFEVQLGRGAGKLPLDHEAFDFSRSIVEEAVKKGDALILPNIQQHVNFSDASSVIDLSLTSAMCIPLIQRPDSSKGQSNRRRFEDSDEAEVLGVIYVDSAQKGDSFTQEDINFFRTLANQATAALINTRLYLQATTDPLCGLYNRRQFELLLKEVYRRSEHAHSPFSVIMLDIDHFKKVNDNYGHHVGDEVIVEVAQQIKKNVRAGDICARYGGEEFSVILANTNADGAMITAEKVRKAIEAIDWPHDDLKTTVSQGVSTWPEQAKDLENLVKKADQALYMSKENGRNRVTQWSPQIDSHAERTDKLAGIITGDYARDYRNINMVFETILTVSSVENLDEMLQMAVDKVLEALEGERSALMLYDEEGELVNTICRDRSGRDLELTTRFSQSIPNKVAQTGQSIYILDAEEDDFGQTESIAELSLRAVMCVPLQVYEEIIGVLYVDSQRRASGFTETDLPFLEALAYQIAVAVENARMKEKIARLEGR